jgi:PhoH-like ATPase
MKKNYVLDTNALLEDPQCIEILRNGEENDIGIPFRVLLELDRLKKDPRLSHLVSRVVDSIQKHFDSITILQDPQQSYSEEFPDLQLLREMGGAGMSDPVLVTNNRILQLLARLSGVESQEFKSSHPYESESQQYTGFIGEEEEYVANAFQWKEGKPCFLGPGGDRVIEYEHTVWNVRPRNVYQNLAFELLLQEKIDLVTLQSSAGYGKTFLALAAALYQVLEKKRFEKIYILKPMVEIGAKMGFLPGDVDEKMKPYMQYLHQLTDKLHGLRPANRILMDTAGEQKKYNPTKLEILPLAFVRGMTIENAFVIVDETQNLSRSEARSLLTRMGENVKCCCLGDTRQVDNPYLNESNNALNWIVKMMRGKKNYAHLVLKGSRSRGPICDAVLDAGL